MILIRTLRSKSRVSHPPPYSLLRSVTSDASAIDPKPRSLSSIFAKPSVVSKVKKPSSPEVITKMEKKEVSLSRVWSSYRPMEEKDFPKELSPEAALLVSRLHDDGYLKDANFSEGGQLEPCQIPTNYYSRHFLKSAAERFGRDHQEIAKWLSGRDLKKVALFGCPSIERKSVFAAKRLRSFFHIQEDVTCRACKLKTSCKFTNQLVGRVEKVILADVMRLITLYTLDSVPRQLSIPDDLKCSIGKLLKEVVSLSN